MNLVKDYCYPVVSAYIATLLNFINFGSLIYGRKSEKTESLS